MSSVIKLARSMHFASPTMRRSGILESEPRGGMTSISRVAKRERSKFSSISCSARGKDSATELKMHVLSRGCYENTTEALTNPRADHL